MACRTSPPPTSPASASALAVCRPRTTSVSSPRRSSPLMPPVRCTSASPARTTRTSAATCSSRRRRTTASSSASSPVHRTAFTRRRARRATSFVGSPRGTTTTSARPGLPTSPTRGAAANRGSARRTSWASVVRASSRALLDGIVAAVPPTATAAAPAGAAGATDVVAALDGTAAGAGSNAYGLGREATVDGAGMVLANPHFPWDGAERFYRMHLRIPGGYDVEGAALIGDPIVEIGHNATLGWSHTVSTARRFVWQRLTLVPGDPTSYLFDGKPEAMTRRTVTIRVPVPTGGTAPVTRTLYDTRFGPVVVVPGAFTWTTSTAYAITDSNATNNRAIDGWIQMGRAGSVRQLTAVLDHYQFLPWVNVIAADATGEALYGDHSVIPRVTDELAAACIPVPSK